MAYLQAISSKNFHYYYQKDYEFLFYNILEPVPVTDKFAILPDLRNLSGATIYNTCFVRYDFTKIENKLLRADVKNFAWHAGTNGPVPNSTISYLTEFINAAATYKQHIAVLDHTDELFPESFLYDYRAALERKYKSTETLKNALKAMRKYLRFYQTKYGIKENCFEILNLRKLAKQKGGNPMSNSDCKLIYEAFKNKEKENPDNRIYTIIFEIFLLSGFRIGEILNIERKNVFENYVLMKTKTSSNDYEKRTCISEINALLNEAITLTKDIPSHFEMYKYIFVEMRTTRAQTVVKRINIGQYFKREIYAPLSSKLSKEYTFNNVRHTFINNAFLDGIKMGVGLKELSIITNNSYKTATAYYRDTSVSQTYAEAMAKVTLSNVDGNGKIMVEEADDNRLAVENGLGVCENTSCDFALGDCLMCRNFVTFPSRMKAFESAIIQINQDIEKEFNELKIQELITQKELLAQYLFKIGSVLENKR